MMSSLKGRTEVLLLCCFEQGAEVLPKPVSWAHSESPLLGHPIPTGDPQSIRRAWCGKKIWLFHENWILSIWRHHGKLSCTSGMCPICISENKLKPPLILVPCQYYSSLHASAFSGLPSAKVTSILICRERSPQGRKSHCFRCCSNTYKASEEPTALWNTSQTYTRQFRHGKYNSAVLLCAPLPSCFLKYVFP